MSTGQQMLLGAILGIFIFLLTHLTHSNPWAMLAACILGQLLGSYVTADAIRSANKKETKEKE